MSPSVRNVAFGGMRRQLVEQSLVCGILMACYVHLPEVQISGEVEYV